MRPHALYYRIIEVMLYFLYIKINVLNTLTWSVTEHDGIAEHALQSWQNHREPRANKAVNGPQPFNAKHEGCNETPQPPRHCFKSSASPHWFLADVPKQSAQIFWPEVYKKYLY